jgi:mannose PTS system EIIA component
MTASPLVVVLAHGPLARSLVDTARMIIGECEGLLPLALEEGEAPAALQQRLADVLARHAIDRPALLLVDLFGGSPSTIAAQALIEHDAAVEAAVAVVTGVNLPMLLETLMSRKGKDVQALAELAAQSGRDGIVITRERLREQGLLLSVEQLVASTKAGE